MLLPHDWRSVSNVSFTEEEEEGTTEVSRDPQTTKTVTGVDPPNKSLALYENNPFSSQTPIVFSIPY